MFVPLWAARIAPYIGGVLLAVGAYVWAYGNGVEDERSKWQAAREELLRLRSEKAQVAAERLAKESVAAPKAAMKETVRVETHWIERPVRECFDNELVRSLEQARAAVRRSATSGASND